MDRYHVPGLSIAVINDGEIEWAQGYGVKRAGASNPVSSSTLFQAASISKPVAAAAALRLVQAGRLALNEDVNLHLRSWSIPANEHTLKQPVTLRGLLSHSAGVTVHGFPGYARGAEVPTLLEILEGAEPANSPPIRVDTIPGSFYRYSGGGYEIVELLMEDVTNKSFEEVMRDLVLRPFGMERSTFEQPLPDALESDVAVAHRYDGIPVAGGWHTYPEQAAAGLWSTPTDLARFAVGLLRAFRGQSQPVLNHETARLMLTRVTSAAGLGPGVHGTGDSLHFDHAGWTHGYRSYLVAYPNTGDGVVVMTNGDGGHDLINEVVRSVARVYGWPHFAPEERPAAMADRAHLDSLAGAYYVSDYDFTMTVEREGGHLSIRTPRGSRYTFYPATETEYFAIEDGSILTFTLRPEARHELSVWGMHAQRVPRP